MPLTAAEVLKIQELDHCRLIAGHRGLNRHIRTVSIMDSPDTPLWLKPGELLITTGYVFKDDTNLQIRLIQELADRNCAGLAIKIKRFLPSIPEPMHREADRLNLPLFEIPYDMSLSDVLYTLTREILDRRHPEYDTRRTRFFTGLLRGELSDRTNVWNRGRDYGLLPRCEYIVLCMMIHPNPEEESPSSARTDFKELVREAESSLNVYLLGISRDDDIVILQSRRTTGPPSSSLARKVANLFLERFSVKSEQTITVGIGTPQSDILHLHKSYREAKEAIDLGRRIFSKTNEGIYEYTDLEPESLLQHLPGNVLTQYVTSTLEVLKRYDRENGTELLHTLELYLNCGRRLGDTARKLYVHRNTVKFRINRIEELLGTDLSDGEAAFRLQLGLRVARLLNGPDRP
ncbi:PucR family transcriptional regulator [Kroppenstedtia eburnea]|uniref:PucR C-terminal helix-turn-helix domain-containing protein n=1 Tax=Kroppenstedtia eburnea TaxID=714067 RepID=A0A1N7IZ01_9BACL|nr:PucR family transcriptional regulator [Kroppenstedtia eburnea]QKI82348.1 hypothetical protein GXN75_10245 [Kroppenstedtia eburnea]SIS42362.1 PucR C-terminal helix-turn-helix domain-containing protein [Kroppenstedtia eburnea]